MSNKQQKKNVHTYDVVITGATGFVGSQLVEKTVKCFPKEQILCLTGKEISSKSNKSKKRIKELGLELREVDLTDRSTLKNMTVSPKLVIHLAAQTDTSKQDHRVNDTGLKNLFEAFGKLSSETHVIYLGTMVNVAGRINCKSRVNEKIKYIPTNEYTRTKSAGEKYLVNKCRQEKFRLTILVPNTIYGKKVRENSLFDILREGIRDRSFVVRLNWPGRSALIHVDDVVSAIVSFYKTRPTPGVAQKFFLYCENLSISEISKIMHRKMKIKYVPIIIPDAIWRILAFGRKYIPKLEFILPASWYNQVWRAGIIVDDVVMAESGKMSRKFAYWKPKHFIDNVSDVLVK